MTKLKLPRVEYVDWGIGNRFGDTIELNKNLVNYPLFHSKVLTHELKHEVGFSLKDLKHDFSQDVTAAETFKFIAKHPKALSQFTPFYWSKKRGFVYDLNLSIIYLAIAIFLCSVSYILWRIA